jgi:hypothetical protein
MGAVGALLGLAGCGYTLNHRLLADFSRPQGIYVPVLANHTDETGAERVFTDALIRELQSRGQVVFGRRETGAYELRGAVESISYTPTVLTDPGFQGLQPYRRLPSELGVNVSISLSLVEPGTGKTLWAKTFTGFRRVETPLSRTYDYQAPSSVGPLTQSLIEEQYANIAGDIMRDVYDEMVEQF